MTYGLLCSLKSVASATLTTPIVPTTPSRDHHNIHLTAIHDDYDDVTDVQTNIDDVTTMAPTDFSPSDSAAVNEDLDMVGTTISARELHETQPHGDSFENGSSALDVKPNRQEVRTVQEGLQMRGTSSGMEETLRTTSASTLRTRIGGEVEEFDKNRTTPSPIRELTPSRGYMEVISRTSSLGDHSKASTTRLVGTVVKETVRHRSSTTSSDTRKTRKSTISGPTHRHVDGIEKHCKCVIKKKL